MPEPARKRRNLSRFRGLESLLRGTPVSAEHPLTLTHKRIFILPTKAGILFALALVAMLLASINYSSNLGYGVTFLLMGVGAVSVLHAFANLSGLSIRLGRTEPAFAGGACRFTLLLRDSGGRGKSGVRLIGEDGEKADVAHVPGDRSIAAILRRTAPSRGLLPLGRVVVATTFPFGLVRAWTKLDPDHACPVYPRPEPRAGLDRHAQDAPQERDRPDSGAQPGVEEFRELRSPTPADPFTRIDWKSYARGRGLLVKDFAASASGTVWLDYSLLPGQDTERKLSLLCRMVLDAEREGSIYGLRLPSSVIGPSRGGEHQHQCLRALALYE